MYREEWLNLAAKELAENVLGPVGYDTNAETGAPILEGLRISISWPSKRALSAKKRVLGETYAATLSKGGNTEILVTYFLDDSYQALAILTHELGHVSVGTKAGHGAEFKRYAKAVGLEGPATTTVAGDAMRPIFEAIVTKLGAIPHDKLDVTNQPKQTTRMLKVVCVNPNCPSQIDGGYKVNMSQKWLSEGAPFCGICHTRMEGPNNPSDPDTEEEIGVGPAMPEPEPEPEPAKRKGKRKAEPKVEIAPFDPDAGDEEEPSEPTSKEIDAALAAAKVIDDYESAMSEEDREELARLNEVTPECAKCGVEEWAHVSTQHEFEPA